MTLEPFLQQVMWQDVAIALGSLVGLLTKMYALSEPETIWTRRSSLVNITFYPPSLVAFGSMGLWITFTTTFLSFITWIGIAIWRAPEEEDWLGRTEDNKKIFHHN